METGSLGISGFGEIAEIKNETELAQDFTNKKTQQMLCFFIVLNERVFAFFVFVGL